MIIYIYKPLVGFDLLSVFERNHHAWWMYSECSSLAWVRRWVQKYTIGVALLVYAITVPNTPWKIHMEPKNGGSGLVEMILPFQMGAFLRKPSEFSREYTIFNGKSEIWGPVPLRNQPLS